LSPEMRKLAEAETFEGDEGHACGAVMRGTDVLPGSQTPSCSKGSRRKLRDLTIDRLQEAPVRMGKIP